MTTTELSASYAEDLARIESRAGSGSWISPLRQRALARFTELGFPTLRDEEWKYTNVAPIRKAELRIASPESGAAQGEATDAIEDALRRSTDLGDEVSCRLVFVDGRFRADLSSTGSLPAGVTVKSLALALGEDRALLDESIATEADLESRAFVALNTALFEDGLFLRLPRGVVLEKPVHAVFVGSGAAVAVHSRMLIIVEDSAQGALIEEHVGPLGPDRESHNGGFSNLVTEVFVGENAAFDHTKLERAGRESYHVASAAVRLSRSSRYFSHVICLGGRLVRNDIDARLDGEDVECTLNGLTVAGRTQHVDNHTRIVHSLPHCRSWELYKAVLADKAHGVFNGKIYVAQDAQKTDAKQTNQSLLLSEGAVMDSKPELEIYADDVKCTHGATIGQLEAEGMFYLRSRGVSKDAARDLLTYAFASDVVEHLRLPALRSAVETMIFEKLSRTLDTQLESAGRGE